MMHRTFYWGKKATILFHGWKTSSWESYFVSLVVLFLSSVILQYISNLPILVSLYFPAIVPSNGACPAPDVPLIKKPESSISLRKRILRSMLFGVRVAIGYLLMLAVMSFNVGVLVAVVLGLVVGHFQFSNDITSYRYVLEKDVNGCSC
ncbi:hypothetical protein KP509_07G042300 [Ceratopteris richardii]|uniref:Copper transport protein n=1 Tax=Ceratopteris richardii TaxID=49495 RepID=A0A8T2UGB9_CERRI|nr:hypothetical protein KP509_07G042300 [Ceratopteris richardii]